ncbi:MAG TPA: response regulator [Puia sp.]|nr:response regulator [Puia sp.]
MKKKKLDCILLIDDDEPTNFLNKMTVEQSGCAEQVHVVQSGKEALEYLTGKKRFSGLPRPDLIFLDINMPAMDGWEFLEKYRELRQDQKADIVMIMLTTSLNPDDETRTKEFPEIAGFEHKPLLQPRLEYILDKFFDQ